MPTCYVPFDLQAVDAHGSTVHEERVWCVDQRRAMRRLPGFRKDAQKVAKVARVRCKRVTVRTSEFEDWQQ
jgi:hypothetical protein